MPAVCNLAPIRRFQKLTDMGSLQPHFLAVEVGILSPSSTSVAALPLKERRLCWARPEAQLHYPIAYGKEQKQNRAGINCCRLNQAAWWVSGCCILLYVCNVSMAVKEFDDNYSHEPVTQPCAWCHLPSTTSFQMQPGTAHPAAHSLPANMHVSRNIGWIEQRHKNSNTRGCQWPLRPSWNRLYDLTCESQENVRLWIHNSPFTRAVLCWQWCDSGSMLD